MTSSAHSERAHAKMSPSAAHRAVECPGSVVLEAQVADDRSSDAANEGTAAHELAAWALTINKDPGDMLGRVIDITGDDVVTRFLLGSTPHKGDTNRWPVDEDMVEAVRVFVDFVRERKGELSVEQRLDISHVHPDCWGTGDAIVFNEDGGHLWVIDYKHGRGVVVEAEGNPQLLLYAMGALKRFDNRGVKMVSMAIVQPRADHPKGPIRRWTVNLEELGVEEAKLRNAYRLVDEAQVTYGRAAIDDGEVGPNWFDAYTAAGDHCRFCKVGATCPTRAAQAMSDAQAEFSDTTGEMTLPEPDRLAPEALADLLTKVRRIQHWCNAVEEHANAEALAGRIPPGFKLVAKRAIRKWADEETVAAMAPMMTSLSPADLFGEPKLLSPAQLEKKLPKAERENLAAFVTKESSGANLVPEDDARPSIRPTAAEEFDAVSD